ncbi:MAG: hypothetical protein CK548_06980 [Opitutia bacterium]|nr:hypothetical protein [Opitutaceae bacterium]PHX71322.1 MAG: hypothetical protein CK548_06980 [Opitutae bacterium]
MTSTPTPVKNFLRPKTLFIVNLHPGRAPRALAAVRSFAATHDARVSLTARPRHATELAARPLDEGVALIVAVGGGGTLNEIAAVLTGTTCYAQSHFLRLRPSRCKWPCGESVIGMRGCFTSAHPVNLADALRR